ncbi:MAG: M23 family peptidase [Calditrichaeota bacterium]|nr:MAG: M23 family peptidase [Calditrichota bacterium]
MKYLITFLIFLFFQSTNIFAQDYLFPTSASNKLTSTFGEFRPGHFHAGLDIKTFGKEGFPVFAIEDGFVWKIRVSPFGYGKAIYLKLNDGKFVVYAHLQKFSPEIEEFVYQKQQKTKKYRVVQEFSSEKFPVKKGDVIAFTGKTGIGHPHLHFEIRDKFNVPMNPLKFYSNIEDTKPPLIQKFVVESQNFESQVNGNFLAQEIPFTSNGKFYSLKDTLEISGSVGLAVEISDVANGVTNSYAPYKVQLFVDSLLTFEVRYDEIPFETTRQVELDRNYRFLRTHKDKMNNLFLKEGNELRNYKLSPNSDGTVGIKNGEGIHDFEIKTQDYFGNTSILKGVFRVKELNQIGIFSAEEKNFPTEQVFSFGGKDYAFLTDWNLKNFKISTNGNIRELTNALESQNDLEASSLILVEKDKTIYEKSFGENSEQFDFEIQFHENFGVLETKFTEVSKSFPEIWINGIPRPAFKISERIFQTSFSFDFLNEDFLRIEINGKEIIERVQKITKDKEKKTFSEDQKIQVDFGRTSLYQDIFVTVKEGNLQVPNTETLGKSYEVRPYEIPLKGAASIKMFYPSETLDSDKLGIFYLENNGKWYFLEGENNSEKAYFETKVLSLEKFVLAYDRELPQILNVYPKNSAKGNFDKIKFRVKDEISGIKDEESVSLTVNDEIVVFEFDPETDEILYKPRQNFKKGKNKFSIEVVDKVGNKQSFKSIFWVN